MRGKDGIMFSFTALRTKGSGLMQYKLSDYRHFPRPVKLILLTEILFGFAAGILNVHLNFYYTVAGLSTVDIGSIGVANALTTALFAILGGLLSGWVGYAPVFISGTLMQGTGLLLCAATNGFPLILAGQIVYAAGLTLVYAVEFPFITYLTDNPYKPASYFFLIFFYALSNILGFLTASALLRFTSGMINPYRVSIWLSAAGFLTLSLLRVRLPNAHPQPQGHEKVSFATALRSVTARSYLCHHMVYAYGTALITSMLNLVYRTAFGFSDERIGRIFSLASLVTVCALVFVPMLLEKISSDRLSGALYWVLFAVLGLSVIAPAPLFVVCMLLRTALIQLYPVVIEAQMLNSLDPALHGRYASLRILAVSIGTGAGAYTTGLLLAYTDYRLLFVLGMLCALIIYCIYRRFCKRAFAAQDVRD